METGPVPGGQSGLEQIGDGGIQTTPSQLARGGRQSPDRKRRRPETARSTTCRCGGKPNPWRDHTAPESCRAPTEHSTTRAPGPDSSRHSTRSDRRTSVAISCSTDKLNLERCIDALGAFGGGYCGWPPVPRLQSFTVWRNHRHPQLTMAYPFGVQVTATPVSPESSSLCWPKFPAASSGWGTAGLYRRSPGRRCLDRVVRSAGQSTWTADTGAMVLRTKGLRNGDSPFGDRGLYPTTRRGREYWAQSSS